MINKFTVKKYSDDERPIIKGNGFDGLEIGEHRDTAEAFVEFINNEIDKNNALLKRSAEVLRAIRMRAEAWDDYPGARQLFDELFAGGYLWGNDDIS